MKLSSSLFSSSRSSGGCFPPSGGTTPGFTDNFATRHPSITLNLGEGNRRRGRDRIFLWSVASGSAEEVRTGLRTAQAWGYVAEKTVREALEVIDRLQAMLWRLTH